MCLLQLDHSHIGTLSKLLSDRLMLYKLSSDRLIHIIATQP